MKHVFEQFVMPPKKKKLKADRHTADVERGFSAQNLICTSLRFECPKSLLLFDLFDYFWVALIV